MKAKILIVIIVAAVLLIAAYAMFIPSGIDDKKPMALITVSLTDTTDGSVLTADLNVGDPTNQLSVIKPMVQMKPLSAYEQTVHVYSTHQYTLQIKAIFTYNGERIKSYSNATFIVFAQKSINGAEYCMYNDEILTQVNSKGAGQGGDPVSSELVRSDFFFTITDTIPSAPSTESVGMNPEDPYYCYGKSTAGGALDTQLLRGVDLDDWMIHCAIRVAGLGDGGEPVTGEVEAALQIHADVAESAGTISVSVDEMFANVNDGALGDPAMLICAAKD
jgi:hypothetical protein